MRMLCTTPPPLSGHPSASCFQSARWQYQLAQVYDGPMSSELNPYTFDSMSWTLLACHKVTVEQLGPITTGSICKRSLSDAVRFTALRLPSGSSLTVGAYIAVPCLMCDYDAATLVEGYPTCIMPPREVCLLFPRIITRCTLEIAPDQTPRLLTP
ncbi:hypothetical protein ACRALDRAFT_2041599 [Sodiomyces alcalophilus JCM 7366]|uniref:uncharacterized protein n=1 Tax=Sodiomyces alcalophilus JCM 7366 TaxID=591952 RepID=UPI0039B678D3